jgi:hypothetical protein
VQQKGRRSRGRRACRADRMGGDPAGRLEDGLIHPREAFGWGGDVELLTCSSARAVTGASLQLAQADVHRSEPISEVGGKGGDNLGEVDRHCAQLREVTSETVRWWRRCGATAPGTRRRGRSRGTIGTATGACTRSSVMTHRDSVWLVDESLFGRSTNRLVAVSGG